MSEHTFTQRLVAIKVRALLHDPPHKSWCISWWAKGRECSHEVEAKRFRQIVLANTLLEGLGIEEVESVVKRADRLAAGVDRWITMLLRDTKPVAIKHLVNIFNPNYRVELAKEWPNLDDLRKGVEELGGKLNKALRAISECAKALDIGDEAYLLSYLVLYSLLELLHYVNGLPQSLADTRAPTHTLYDHLYATSTMANTLLHGEGEPRGYLVLIDVPGIQEYVSAARRAGDFRAGSWLLTRLVWYTVRPLVEVFGPDVLLTPTLRATPLLADYLLEKLDKIREELEEKQSSEQHSKYCVEKLKELEKLVVETYAKFLGKVAGYTHTGQDRMFIKALANTALLPATITLILPSISLRIGDLDVKLDNAGNVVETIKRLYLNAWNRLLEDILVEARKQIENAVRSEKTKDKDKLLLNYLILLFVEEVIRNRPPTGLRVVVVDLGKVYNSLYECLVESKNKACTDIRLGSNVVELVKDVDKESRKHMADTILLHLAFKLLGELPRECVEKGYIAYTIPLPTTFWVGSELKPVHEAITQHRSWIPCSLCGQEPIVLRMRKVVKRPGLEEFRDEDVERLADTLRELVKRKLDQLSQGVKPSIEELLSDLNKLKEVLRKLGFRPGEAQGPYCLLRRTLQHVVFKRKDIAEIMSTDEVALRKYLKILERIVDKNPCSEYFISEVGESAEETRGVEKDKLLEAISDIVCLLEIESAAVKLGLDMENLRNYWLKMVKNFIDREFRDRRDELAKKIIDALDTIYGFKTVDLLGDVLKVDPVEVVKDRLDRVLERILRLRTKYVIARGDADSIGDFHAGRLGVGGCENYVKLIASLVEEMSEPKDNAKAVAKKIRETSEVVCKLVSAIDEKAEVLVSPTYKSTLSMALQLTALKDLVVIRESNGVLVFSGGDDILALLPVDSLTAVFSLRQNYAGSKDYFHLTGGGVPITSAIPGGRSFSIRVVELMDIMADEIVESYELMEEVAKNSKWLYGSQKWVKDAIVITYSRGKSITVLPLSYTASDGRRILLSTQLAKAVSLLQLLLWLGVLSASVPEDFELRYQELIEGLKHVDVADAFILARYVVDRNLSLTGVLRRVVREKHLDLAKTLVSKLPYSIYLRVKRVDGEESSFKPIVTQLMGLIRVLRVIP